MYLLLLGSVRIRVWSWFVHLAVSATPTRSRRGQITRFRGPTWSHSIFVFAATLGRPEGLGTSISVSACEFLPPVPFN